MARIAAKQMTAEAVGSGETAAKVRREKRLLSKALDEYEAAMLRRRTVNADTVISTLKRGLGDLMAREVESLTRAEIVDAVEKLEATNLPGAAQYLRRSSQNFLEWCVSRGLVQFNVMASLHIPLAAARAEKSSDDRHTGRALADAEILAVWLAAEAFGSLGGIVRLGLLTAMRQNELARLKKQDILNDRIFVETQYTETRVHHEIPLTAAMRAVLNSQSRATSPLVFGSFRNQGSEIIDWSKLIPPLNKASGVDFTLDDLSRTCRELMSRLGVPEDHAEIAIGHVHGNLVDRFDRQTAWDARVHAFAQISDHIVSLLSADVAAVRHSLPKKVRTRARP